MVHGLAVTVEPPSGGPEALKREAAVWGKSPWSSGPPWSPEYHDSWVSSWYKYQGWVIAPSFISQAFP